METVAKARPGQYLIFTLQDRPYGVAIDSVREINRMIEIAAVPRAPHNVAGVIDLRGKILPVLNLRHVVGMPAAAATRSSCIIVLDRDGGQVGVVVDAVNGVVDLTAAQIDVPPDLGATAELPFVTGIGRAESGIIILIDAVSAVAGTEHVTQPGAEVDLAA